MGCDYYTREIVVVHLTSGECKRQNLDEEPQRGYFPEYIYRHTDINDENEVEKVENEHLKKREGEPEVVWIPGHDLRSLYKRVLADLSVSLEDVVRITREISVWR